MLCVAILTVREGALAELRRYEHAAASIMQRHGGAIERVVVLPGPPLRELHLIRFPSQPAFDAYREDPALAELRSLREACIERTELWPAEDGPAYGA